MWTSSPTDQTPRLVGPAEQQYGSTERLVGPGQMPDDPCRREAFDHLTGCRDKELLIVPGASHLFEEPGTLEEVARLAAQWFATYPR